MKLTANIFLHNEFIGTLESNGKTCQFLLNTSYKQNVTRNTLSLSIANMSKARLELFEYPQAPLPPFVKSMLPEGGLRSFLIEQSGMVLDENAFAADAYLLSVVGHDLMGAVEIRDVVNTGIKDEFNKEIAKPDLDARGCFSLPGVQKKFSFKRRGLHFYLPVKGEVGDFILKPQPEGDKFPNIVLNEYFHMRLAQKCGLEVPEIGIVRHSDLEGVQNIGGVETLQNDGLSFYIKRFDRDVHHKIHMEELHQALRIEGVIDEGSKYDDFSFVEVLGFLYAVDVKYQTNLSEGYLKEMCFSFVIGNTDFHLKNTAILYPDRIKPVKAPSYDLLNTQIYQYSAMPMRLGISRSLKNIQDFDNTVFLELLEASDCPFDYQFMYEEMCINVEQHFMTVFDDPIMKIFNNAAFKQRLIELFNIRIQGE